METSLSSTLHPHSYQVPSKTMDTSMNSSQASEYEEAKSVMSRSAKSSDYALVPKNAHADNNLFIDAKPTLPTNFEEDTWAKLKSAICAIFLKQPNSCDFEKLYQAVNDLCLYKMGVNLHQQIEKECEAHISAALQSLVGQSPDLVVFLSLVERCWQDLCDQMLMIRGIALYLDRTYVKQTANVRSLWDMGLQLFRKHLSLSPEVEHKTVTGLLRMIESER
ncbi:hypothetical protein JHK87_043514 [Glycine soja]|nr:hypothetical protein JHK87_043514 [Glycine soja]